MIRQMVYNLIDGEREYQDSLHERLNQNQIPLTGELVLLRAYLRKAEEVYTETFGDSEEKPTMDIIRKIAGICVRCMEHNETPHRK